VYKPTLVKFAELGGLIGASPQEISQGISYLNFEVIFKLSLIYSSAPKITFTAARMKRISTKKNDADLSGSRCKKNVADTVITTFMYGNT
jgi:hypothetical protein